MAKFRSPPSSRKPKKGLTEKERKVPETPMNIFTFDPKVKPRKFKSNSTEVTMFVGPNESGNTICKNFGNYEYVDGKHIFNPKKLLSKHKIDMNYIERLLEFNSIQEIHS
jgi:hypothetical protein